MKAMNKPLRRRKREDDSDYDDELTDHEVKFNTTQRLTKKQRSTSTSQRHSKLFFSQFFLFQEKKSRDQLLDSDFFLHSRKNSREIMREIMR
jgi:hypothetical protein